jgi:hypothetical protein
MAYAVEVKYFNSFLLKKVVDNANDPIWPSLITATTENNTRWPKFDESGAVDVDQNWVIEEARLRGGYNNVSVGYGVKAYAVEPNPNASLLINGLIYSGIFNSRTSVNQTNVFSVGDAITKSADPANGSIQKLYAEDTNLIIFQENKVSRALIDKDAIYSAEGGGTVTNVNTTIGTIQPYQGQFGISKNPESFAVYGFQKYFTDKNRNAVMRLSLNGLEEISKFGMIDYFRDQLTALGDGKAIGAYDVYSKQYVLSLQSTGVNAINDTLTFDESVKGWVSFMDYIPSFMFSLKNKFYSTTGSDVYEHFSNDVDRNSFYGTTYRSSVTLVHNPKPSLSKVFKTINYEGDSGWTITAQTTSEGDIGNPILSYLQGTYDSTRPTPRTGAAASSSGFVAPINYAGFAKKEGKYHAKITNGSSIKEREIIFGNEMTGIKGYYSTVTIATDLVTNVGNAKELFAVSTNYVESSY